MPSPSPSPSEPSTGFSEGARGLPEALIPFADVQVELDQQSLDEADKQAKKEAAEEEDKDPSVSAELEIAHLLPKQQKAVREMIAAIGVAYSDFLQTSKLEDSPVIMVGFYSMIASVVSTNPFPVEEVQKELVVYIRRRLMDAKEIYLLEAETFFSDALQRVSL